MSKKTSRYRGYVLLESLIALGLLCMIIGMYISLNTFLLKKNKQAKDQLQLHRVLYEEMKYYENHGGTLFKEVDSENKSYRVRFYKAENKLIKLEISNEKESITIKKN